MEHKSMIQMAPMSEEKMFVLMRGSLVDRDEFWEEFEELIPWDREEFEAQWQMARQKVN
jgi:hypothetical protein